MRKTSLAFAEKSFSTHVELYRTLDSLPMPPACNKQLFENLIYHYKHVKNIGVIKMDYYVCDMYGASKLNQSIKHYDTFQNNQGRVYKYWRNQDYASVASPDGYFVEYDASAYLDFDIKNEIGALFIYGRQSDEIWFSQIRHNLSNTDLNKIKTLLVEKFRALNANPVAKSLFVKQSNLMIGLFIVDEGTIIAVATDTDYVQSYNKTGLLNLAVGLLVGLLMSLTFLHFYAKSKSLKSQLIHAIKNEELTVVYQPLVDMQTSNHAICGFEALARWTLKNGDIIKPEHFIKVAEKNGLSHQLTRLIIKRVFTEISELLQQHQHLYVAINVSPKDLYHDQLLIYLQEIIQHYDLSPTNVVIEITERTMVDQYSQMGIEALKNAQFKISLDDFGTGASNVKYLADLKPEIIKIDKAFVTWSDFDGPTSTLLASMINIVAKFNAKIVVEGVETPAQAQRCLQLGANIGQGYFWYRPLPISEIKKLDPKKFLIT